MGRINSRSKGQRGEHQAIEFMKEWTGMDFKRTPGSGGLRGHVVDYTEGDIVCVKKNYIFPLCVEVKFYDELNFNHLLYDVKSKIKEFWVQASESAKRAEKIPILFIRYNGLPKNFFFVILGYKFYHSISIFRECVPKLVFNKKFVITNTNELQKFNWIDVDRISKQKLKI